MLLNLLNISIFGISYLKQNSRHYFPSTLDSKIKENGQSGIKLRSAQKKLNHWERLNVGSLPMVKMHPVGSLPTVKMHPVGTLPTVKMHPVGSLP